MKLSYLSAISLVAPLTCLARPVKRASANDELILNFALTLEHLENAFYSEGLAAFDEDAFAAVGLPPFARGRISQIAHNEATHVATLEGILGADATQPCNYTFPFSDAKAFVTLSAVLESVGTSAYTGAANLLNDSTLVTSAASILAVEARQAAFVASAVNKQNPWSTAFETPLDLKQAFSLASGFIFSCPPTNPNLYLSAFPSLTITTPSFVAGESISLSFNASAAGGVTASSPDETLFLALLTGLDKRFVPITGDGLDGSASALLPADLQGTVYALVTNTNATVSDAVTVAGVAILQFPFDSQFNTTL